MDVSLWGWNVSIYTLFGLVITDSKLGLIFALILYSGFVEFNVLTYTKIGIPIYMFINKGNGIYNV